MKNVIKTQASIVQKFKLLPFLGVIVFGVVIAFTTFYLTIPKTSVAWRSALYPSMSFHDPILISGVDGAVNAVYKFEAVSTGIDAHIRIVNLQNGATLNSMDHFTAGYYNAWQPFLNIPASSTSWIDWEVKFKMAGTNIDTVLTRLAATAIDVDGDNGALKEIVGAHPVKTYSAMAGAQVVVTFRNDSCIATSSTNNIATIDTSRYQAMFMKIFNNVSTINYRTGSENGGGGTQVRQNSIYFKYFDAMPSPLPVELISFKATKISNDQVQLQWSTASEKDNDFFTIERSQDGTNFTEIKRVKGAGNCSVTRNYTTNDKEPKVGVNYYRLSQTDYDGTTELLKVISINMDNSIPSPTKSKVVLNPFTRNFSVLFNASENIQAQVVLLSLNGHMVFKENIEITEGKNEYHFANGDELKPGAYILKIQTDSKVIVSEKVIKN